MALRRVFSEDNPESGQVRHAGLTIDYDRRRVIRDGEEIRLTPKEFELLSLLARNADRVMTHHTILKAIWGPHAVDQPEHLWVLVAQLRKKVERDPSHPRVLVSEPWVGYRFASRRERQAGGVARRGIPRRLESSHICNRLDHVVTRAPSGAGHR